jgi:hypothetical protein
VPRFHCSTPVIEFTDLVAHILADVFPHPILQTTVLTQHLISPRFFPAAVTDDVVSHPDVVSRRW